MKKTIFTAQQLESIYGKSNITDSRLDTEVKKENDDGLIKKTGDLFTDVVSGAGKGVTETAIGLGELALKAGALTPGISETSKEILKGGVETAEDIKNKQLQATNLPEKIGKFGEQVAEFAIPSSKVVKATKELNLAGKIIPRALTSGGVATAQSGKIGKETALATAVETAIPLGSEVVYPFVKRIVKGLASGLSGVGTDVIDRIVKNPKVASETIKELNKVGNFEILKKNAEKILNGIPNIKKEARNAFRIGLESLKSTDIDEKTFNNLLEKEVGKFSIKDLEFSDPKNVKKASNLVEGLFNLKLDGKSLRGYIDDIESSAYKIATSDERLAFNAFIRELSSSLKKVVSSSTSKLDDINREFSKDMNLAQSIESIFGKVKFKNASELNKISQKLENVFSQKGLSPEYLDNFLNRIGLSPEGFKTEEAVRQITGKVSGSNTKGLSVGEILQQVSSSILTPKLVRDISILTGKTEPVIKKLLEKTSPTLRGALIKSMIEEEK